MVHGAGARKGDAVNCKKGDLAVIVRSFSGNDGVLVTCLSCSVRISAYPDGDRRVPVWRVDRQLMDYMGRFDNYVPDDQLRPIRDSDGADEMLRIAGRPRELEKS